MMEITDSGHITGADWDGGTLVIRFRDGSEYEYQDVSYSKFQELLAAPSKHQYFEAAIKGVHEYARR